MNTLETYIQKGEVILVKSNISFDMRNKAVRNNLKIPRETVLFAKEKILVDDIRDFAYELQKESIDNTKLAILVCDDIAIPAQHALLKIFEDLDVQTCIMVYIHEHAVFLSTVLSRVIVKYEEVDIKKDKKNELDFTSKHISKRLEIVKNILKKVEDEEVSKQDVTSMLEELQKEDGKHTHTHVFTRALSMLKQPSVSIKYVLEYVAMSI